MKKEESLGIKELNPGYLNLLPNQDFTQELLDIYDFINWSINTRFGKIKDLQFINYGRTQLVFVITLLDNTKYTLLVNQPSTTYGVGENEYDNLNKLSKVCPDIVVKPIYYFSKNNKELYLTPYYYQARCIGVDSNWGIWVPEPNYHFEEFSKEQRSIINSIMVSTLIRLYDDKLNKGLSECRLDGGDFMLVKGFENEELNIENILKNIKLIAARNTINISLNDYINILKIELLKSEDNMILGRKLKKPLTKDEIENGINLGLMLRNEKNKIKVIKK